MTLVLSEGAVAWGAADDKGIFFIDRFEVTNRSYLRFVEASGYRPRDSRAAAFLAHWDRTAEGALRPVQGRADFPVAFVHHEDAQAYARHSGKDLPTREQWLTAALGKPGRLPFPWGDRFMPFYCNSWRSGIGGPSRVGTFEYGRSEWGCYDMVGNVAEWTNTMPGEVVEPSYYVMGGSWTDGGNPEVEEATFDLRQWVAFAESLSRNSTLGFRCVRNDAAEYIRDRIVPLLGGPAGEDRTAARQELSRIATPLYDVLKLLEFETRVIEPIPLPFPPSLVRFELTGQPRLIYCFSNGIIRSTNLQGEILWDHQEEEPDISYRYYVIPPAGEPANKIALHGWYRSLLRVLDSGDGQPLWHAGEVGTVRHLLAVPEKGNTGPRLLVDWYLEDRDSAVSDEALQFLDEMLLQIEITARSLLSPGFFLSPCRDERLSVFVKQPGTARIEPDSLFSIDRFGMEALHIDRDLNNRVYIQLDHGVYSNVEVRSAPGNRLVMYDLESGAVCWATDFPGALFGASGVIRQEPIQLQREQRIVAVLEDEEPYTRKINRCSVCTLDLDDGSIRSSTVMNPGETVRNLIPLQEGASLFAGLSSTGDFLCFQGEPSGDVRVERLSMAALLEDAATVQRIEESDRDGSSPSPQDLPDASAEGLRPLDLWVCPSTGSPWLVVETIRGDSCYLLTGFRNKRFTRIYPLQGLFSHHACLSVPQDQGDSSFLWIWDDTGFLLCFDTRSLDFLWSKKLGNLSSLAPSLSDLDGNGSLEGVVTSHGGDLKALDLETGRIVLDLKGRGLSYSFVQPVDIDQDGAQELLVGLSEGPGLILEGKAAERVPWEQALEKSLQTIRTQIGDGSRP